MVKIVPSDMTDCQEIAENMREQDIIELSLANGYAPLQALVLSYTMSHECNTIMYNDKPIGMFGVVNSGMFSSPWLLGTDELEKIPVPLVREGKKWVEETNAKHPLLINYVHKDNTVAIQWLKHLGFKFIRLYEKHGVGQAPFYQFVRIKECVTHFTT